MAFFIERKKLTLRSIPRSHISVTLVGINQGVLKFAYSRSSV